MSDGTGGVERPGATLADRATDRYAAGEEAAFGDRYDELARRLYCFALRWTGGRTAAEDAVQQTLLQLHCARQRFVRDGSVLPWAHAIARRLLIDLGRRGAPEARRELEALPAAWREPFELMKLEVRSVAEVLGIAQGMVKIRTHRATLALRLGVDRLGEAGWVGGGSEGWAQNPGGLSVLSFGRKLPLELPTLDAEPMRRPLPAGPSHGELRSVVAGPGPVSFAGHQDGPVMHTGDADPAQINGTGVTRAVPR